jgi:hypothetical protein
VGRETGDAAFRDLVGKLEIHEGLRKRGEPKLARFEELRRHLQQNLRQQSLAP